MKLYTEEKWFEQVTKESLSARVVDRQQVHRTISKEEMLHLFEFGDDENPDTSPKLEDQESRHVTKPNNFGEAENGLEQKLPINASFSAADKLMESLLGKHHPRYIQLLQTSLDI